MSLRSTTHRGKRVSLSHAAMLRAYEHAHGVELNVNQGRRTIAEQAGFYRIFLRDGRPRAAPPTPNAPHIKRGHEHHALDIDDGVVDEVAAFYRSHGVPVAFNVTGEPWHMDTLDEAALKAAAAKVGTIDVTLKRGAKGPSVVCLKKLLHAAGVREFSANASSNRYDPFYGQSTETAVKRFQTRHDLKADGIAGPTTWAALRRRAK